MFTTTVRKSLVVLAAAAATAAAIAPAASASNAVRTGTNGHVLKLTAAPGEANNIEVYSRSTYVLVWERNNTDPLLGEPAGCVNFNANQVQCPRSVVDSVYVDAGDRGDRLVADLGATISLVMDGGAGNDFVDVKGTAGTVGASPTTPNLLGGDGSDQVYGWQFSDNLTGGNGDDILGAGYGNDHLNGGAGIDRLDGGQDNDTISARDSQSDYVACGTGWDSAQVDAHESMFTGCERTF